VGRCSYGGARFSEHVVADYEKLRLSLKGDPMQFLRELFRSERILSCADLNATKHGTRVKCGGVVITRQMPGDAGVVFMTLRDETGYCNALAWPSIFEVYRREIMGSRIIVIEGEVQRSEEGVVHLISSACYDRSGEIERLSEDRFRPQSHDDQIPPPPDPRGMQRHPREVRVLPKSRDFH
jgi:error-prone DNA polymerase